MPFIVRKITNKRRFDKPSPDQEWIKKDEIPADAVTDLRTNFNSLSVFVIDDDDSEVDRVISALASQRQKIDYLDYILLDERKFQEILEEFGMSVKISLGSTPDETVNNWHRNLIELTDRKVAELARTMIFFGQKKRKAKKDVRALVDAGISNGKLDTKKVHPDVLNDIVRR